MGGGGVMRLRAHTMCVLFCFDENDVLPHQLHCMLALPIISIIFKNLSVGFVFGREN